MLHVYESNASLQFSTFGNLLSSSTRARMFMGLTAMRSRASWLSTNSMCCQLMPSRLYSCCEHKPSSVCQAYPVRQKPPQVCNIYPVRHKPPQVCQAYPVRHKPPQMCQAYPVTNHYKHVIYAACTHLLDTNHHKYVRYILSDIKPNKCVRSAHICQTQTTKVSSIHWYNVHKFKHKPVQLHQRYSAHTCQTHITRLCISPHPGPFSGQQEWNPTHHCPSLAANTPAVHSSGSASCAVYCV